MSHNPARPYAVLLCLLLLLTSVSCQGKPSTPSPSLAASPSSALPATIIPSPTTGGMQQSSITPQSTVTPQATLNDPHPTDPAQSTVTTPSAIDSEQSTITPELATPTSQPGISDQPSAGSLTQYYLSAQFDFYRHSLSVMETITYTNVTSQALKDLLLVVPANRWSGAFKLTEIRWADGEPILDFALHLHRLTVLFPQPLLPGEQVSLRLAYDLLLPPIPEPSSAAPQPFGFTLSQTNLVDWYAYVPPYRDGWLAHDPGYWGEYQVFDLGDFQVDLTLFNAGEGMAIAASTPPFETFTGDGITYRYQLPSARTFALSFSPSYQVTSQTVELNDSSVTIFSYGFPLDAEAAQAALTETARALQLYSELFGSYPRQTLSVVEADFLDGMEYDGLYFLSKGFYNLYDGTPNGYLTAIAVHEVAHQWWYGLVGNDQALDPWLDEALCTFMERVYYERFYPEALTRWWQPYRVDYYDPAGWVDGSIYDYIGYRAYRDAVYLNGQRFLQAARLRLGDPAFLAFLKEYLTRYRGQIASTQDFLALLASYSAEGYEDLVGDYFGAFP